MATNSFDFTKTLNRLRLENTGFDVIIQIGTRTFQAHRIVLIARLEYFRAMLATDMRERSELIIPLDPSIIDPTIFDNVLEFIYTSTIQFTNDNVQRICKAADFLCFNELLSQAESFMKSNLDMDIIALYTNIAKEFNLISLENECEQFIATNSTLKMEQIRHISSLLSELPFEELLQRFANLDSEEDRYRCSIEWIVHDEANRWRKLPEILKQLPVEGLSYKFLTETLSKEPFVQNNNECLQLLMNVLISKQSKKLTSDRVYVFGGRNGRVLSSVSRYDSLTMEWIEMCPMPIERTHFGCSTAGSRIYICGGYDGGKNMKRLDLFDAKTQKWRQLKPMKYRRNSCGMAVLNDSEIYVAGGFDVKDVLSVVERYSIPEDEWYSVARMIYPRNGLELVSMNGYLYAIGGIQGGKNEVLKSVERYDPERNEWKLVAHMSNVFQSFGCAVLENRIYAAGGGKCEVYDPEVDRWTEMPAPTVCEGGRRLVVFNGNLLAIGGRVGELRDGIGLSTVEMFDSDRNEWIPQKNMNTARCYSGVAVVNGECFVND